ncbi:hypothetical protein NSQ20_25485 [Paenibacillus sp. FSL K6-1122]|uniref:hypothetical protein n=1 Tax=Paenibacillus sp. FSL K6-1122 TaxID=2954512 RepID=UPI0030EF10DE
MTDIDSEVAKKLVDQVTHHYKGINMTISDATLDAIRTYRQSDFTLSDDTISRINQIGKDWDMWGKNISEALNTSEVFHTLSMVDKQMNSVRDALTTMFENVDLSVYKTLGESLEKVMERHFDDSNEHPEFSTVFEERINPPGDASDEDNTSPIFNVFAGYLSATYGQQFDPSRDRNKIVIMFLFIFLSQIGTNLLNTSIEKAIYPEKDNEQKVEYPYSNYTKEQIDRALDLEERKLILQENEQKKDSK